MTSVPMIEACALNQGGGLDRRLPCTICGDMGLDMMCSRCRLLADIRVAEEFERRIRGRRR
jgi:hypothetical protein